MTRSARRAWALLLGAAGVVVVLYLVRVALWRPLELTGQPPADGYARSAGVVHVHTRLSDGGGSPQEVIDAARAAGLGFVAITDHNHLDAKPLEGYHQRVLVLVGTEISTPSGHLLGLGLDHDPAYRFNGDALGSLEDVRDLGGIAFAAHPFSARADLRWTGWDLPGPWGIEVVNVDSEWRRAGPRLLLSAALYHLNPRYALLSTLSEPDEARRRWDEVLARRDAVAIAGADAHSRLPLTRRFSLRFPSYQALFGLVRDHLLLERPLCGDLASDRAAVLSALRRGRFYVGVDALAPADGFSFTVEGAGGRWTMGEAAPAVEGLRARAGGRVPQGTRLLLLRDGARIAEATERLDAPLPGPGVYRVEARVPGWTVPWVITNPVTVFDEAAQEARRAAAAWPSPQEPAAALPLAALPGSAEFVPESDATSTVDRAVLDAGAGPRGGEALKLAFRLGAPSRAQPFTWCALVNRQARDLAAWRGLLFHLKADGEYRIWVQVRDLNPASADSGLEWWLAAARTSSDWQEVQLPFARFRTINPRTDGRLDLDRTRAIVFVLDPASVKPGTRGTIWIADLSVYR
ncbi:MAG TPA: CehA/McbA family metallohydrolase [Vicinamibacteria bacterium]|nr:CehA/McbA family metallohydrolase [Vicinamibacteria bacterium]